MKYTKKQTGNSRNRALMRRAARLGCGISVIAMSAMLTARPARATGPDNPAGVLSNAVPADSSSGGFVTAGSDQQNTGVAIAALVNDATGNSTVENTGEGSLPSTASVTGNELAAFATGSGQTNTVDLATIGTSDDITGIAVLADQANIYNDYTVGEETFYTPETINSTVTDSDLANETTNATSGDSLTDQGNLITAQTTGNVADSSVEGVVPINYGGAEPGSGSTLPGSGSASGNVVVASSQTNTALDGGAGSYATVGGYEENNYTGVEVDASGEDGTQDLALSVDVSGNEISSAYLGNSADDLIGVALTSGTLTGAPSFDGSLVIANQQTTTDSGYLGGTFGGSGALTYYNDIGPDISGGYEEPLIDLVDGAVTTENNKISSSAVENSAVGAAGAPGNEISLGINLAGVTTSEGFSNTISGSGTLSTGADLALSNQQSAAGQAETSVTEFGEIYASVQGLSGSTVGLANNAVSSSALANDASNAIDTASGAGINLISGLTALTSQQNAASAAGAATAYFGTGIYSGTNDLGITNASESISNDQITATAGENQVTNGVSLASSTIDAGAQGDAVSPAYLTGTAGGVAAAIAGISLNNQQNTAAPAAASANHNSTDIAIYAYGTIVSNSNFVVTNPVLSATAKDNNAANSIIADASQGVSGSIGLLNTQSQGGGAASASLDESDNDYGNYAGISVGAGTGGISGVSALLSGSSFAAEATDNEASNTLDATGGTLSNAVDGTIGLAAQLAASNAAGAAAQDFADLALSNVQLDEGSGVGADDEFSVNYIDADASDGPVSDSTFTISGPANNAPESEALAIGNEALNDLSAVASTVLTDTAGLVNAQENVASAYATLGFSYAGVQVNSYADDYPYEDGNDGGNVSDTSITVGTGAAGGSNAIIMRALAYDNEASNQLSVSAETVAPAETGEDYTTDGSVIGSAENRFDTGLDTAYSVGAAYSVLNDMYAYDSDDTEANAYGLEIGASIGNSVTNPTLTDVTASTAGNAMVSSVFANQANNGATLSVGNLAAESYYPVADVTNLQSADVDSIASLSDEGDDSFITENDGSGEVLDSTLGVTDNTALAQVEVNQADNSLDTEGGNITDAAASEQGLSALGYLDGQAAANAAFSVQNVQYADSDAAPTQTETDALISTGGDVDLSALTADGNAFESTAYGNNATNSLTFGGTSPVDLLDTSAGLQNVQYGDDYEPVTLGTPGTLAVPAGSPTEIASVPYSVSSGYNYAQLSGDGATLTVSGEDPLVFDVSDLSGAALTDFEDLFTVDSGGSTYYDSSNQTFTLTSGTYFVSDTSLFNPGGGDYIYNEAGSPETGQSTNADTIAGTPAIAAVPASPSVLITVAGNITGSTLDVSSNAFDAKSIDNAAVNTESIAATTVQGGGDIPAGEARGGTGGASDQAAADYALSNNQSGDSGLDTSVFGEAGINPTNTSTITSSTLMVSDNTQLARAEGNTADNTLSLTATNTAGTPPTFALVSNQTNDDGVGAAAGSVSDPYEAGLTVTAPGAINDSTLTMDDNSSEALAVSNDVTNLLSASAANLDTANEDLTDANADLDDGLLSYADYSLTNSQDGYGATIGATGVLQVENADSSSVSTTGLVDSTADLSGNAASAYAEVNTASNTLDMSAGNSTATGALANAQAADDTVAAIGSATVMFALNGSTDPDPAAATDSAINVSNNSLQVQGIGNQATNALNVTTGASYGAQANALANPHQAQATYAVLNAQDNAGAVSASVPDGASFGVALNGGGSETPVTNATVTVSYNVVDAKAFGNSAVNSMTVATLNSGNATATLQNTQTNEGAVSSTVSDVGIGSDIGAPGVSGAGVAVGDNEVVASAVGNVATNSIVH